MRKSEIDTDAVFQRFRGAAQITGLSVKYIRQGCINGTIPHIRAGSDYLVNMPLFMAQLDEASKENIKTAQ